MRTATDHLRLGSLNTFSQQKAFKRAQHLFQQAAQRVPAYKDFLHKHKIKPEKITTESDFKKLPTPDKANYISQYSLDELSWDGKLQAKFISTSSGSTGTPFFWPRGYRQDRIAGTFFKGIYETIFHTKKVKTLSVDSFALGTWIAGLEFYNATKYASDRGNLITVITPGIDKFEAIREIKQLSPSFNQIILGGYPPFIKDIVEIGSAEGFDWKKTRTRLLTGGEAISEVWRDRMHSMISKEQDLGSIINVYGMAETGVVAHETPVSVLLRKCIGYVSLPFPMTPDISGLYQYHPLMRYFEIEGKDSIVLTSDAGFPLIRYNTRDQGGIVDLTTVLEQGGTELTQAAKRHGVDLLQYPQPFIYLHGRKDLSISLYALQIYVEHLKAIFEKAPFSPKLSGLFVMGVELTENLDQRFAISVELSRGKNPNALLKKEIATYVVRELGTINSEYARLCQAIGRKAVPKISLLPYGKLDTVPGRKHKWVRRK